LETLTDRAFWKNYWASKENVCVEIPENYLFHDLFEGIISKSKPTTVIEIGGFPGYYSVFLNKYLQLKPTLLDFYIDTSIIQRLCEVNRISDENISVIESDFFNVKDAKEFDIVFSAGFIEHFEDTKDVISQHVNLLKKGGVLFISLPNFKGFNGRIQKRYDKENLDKHNLNCMDIDFLKSVCTDLNLRDVEVEYYGRFGMWLENMHQQKSFTRIYLRWVKLFWKIIFAVFPFNSKMFSPYIIIIAKK
jgi:SAM-dependent methyltransferase